MGDHELCGVDPQPMKRACNRLCLHRYAETYPSRQAGDHLALRPEEILVALPHPRADPQHQTHCLQDDDRNRRGKSFLPSNSYSHFGEDAAEASKPSPDPQHHEEQVIAHRHRLKTGGDL